MTREISNKSVSPMNLASASFTPQMRAGTASKQNFLSQQGRFPPTVQHVQRLVEDDIKAVFYSDVVGINPTIACICSDNELPDAKVLKNARTTRITSKGRRRPCLARRPRNFVRCHRCLDRRRRCSLARRCLIRRGRCLARRCLACCSLARRGLDCRPRGRARRFSCVITMH